MGGAGRALILVVVVVVVVVVVAFLAAPLVAGRRISFLLIPLPPPPPPPPLLLGAVVVLLFRLMNFCARPGAPASSDARAASRPDIGRLAPPLVRGRCGRCCCWRRLPLLPGQLPAPAAAASLSWGPTETAV